MPASQGVSNNDLKSMFAYLNQHNKNNSNDNSSNNNRYNIREPLVFGEELNTYFPTLAEQHYSVMERDPLYPVRALATQITLRIYGEPKLSYFIAGIYGDLVKSRLKSGYKGVRGKNMKGLVCAILYILVLYEDGARLTIDTIVKAANTVQSKAKTKITDKMVNRYIKFVIENILVYKKMNNNRDNNNANNSMRKCVELDVKRLGLVLQFNTQSIFAMKRVVRSIPASIFEFHIPRTVAGGVVYWYSTEIKRPEGYPTNDSILKALGLSRSSVKKVIDKFKNVSLILK